MSQTKFTITLFVDENTHNFFYNSKHKIEPKIIDFISKLKSEKN